MKKLLVVVLFLLVILIFLPQILSPFFSKIVQSKLNGKIVIEKTSLSWFGPQNFENITLSDKEFSANIVDLTSPLPLWKLAKIKEHFSLSGGRLKYGDATLIGIEVSRDGKKIKATGNPSQGGNFSIHGTESSVHDYELMITLEKIPTIIIDRFLDLKGYFYKIAGNTMDATGTYTNHGLIKLEVRTPKSTLSFEGKIINDFFTLTMPLILNLDLDPLEIGKIKAVSQQPISLRIFPGDFSFSIKNFKNIQVTSAICDLGRLQINENVATTRLLSIFGLNSVRSIECWLTPITFSIKNSLLKMDRMDALLEKSIHLCLWGDVNLKKETLEMTLGIPADTLMSSFDIHTVSSNFVLQVPLNGTLQDPVLQSGPAIAKITAMKAAGSIPSTPGKVIGGLINIFTQKAVEEDVPNPNSPFPWEN